MKIGKRLEAKVRRRAEAHWAREVALRSQASQFAPRGPLGPMRRRLIERAKEHEETAVTLELLIKMLIDREHLRKLGTPFPSPFSPLC